MKKLIILLVCAVVMVMCGKDEKGKGIEENYITVTSNDPEFNDPEFNNTTFIGRGGIYAIDKDDELAYREDFVIDDINKAHYIKYTRSRDEMGFYLHTFKIFVNGNSYGNPGDIYGIHNQNKFIEDFEMYVYGTYDYGSGLKSILNLKFIWNKKE